MAWKIFQGSYTKQIFNQFVYTEVLPRMNAYSEYRPPRSVLVMDNARIYCSEELQQMWQRGRRATNLFAPLLA